MQMADRFLLAIIEFACNFPIPIRTRLLITKAYTYYRIFKKCLLQIQNSTEKTRNCAHYQKACHVQKNPLVIVRVF